MQFSVLITALFAATALAAPTPVPDFAPVLEAKTVPALKAEHELVARKSGVTTSITKKAGSTAISAVISAAMSTAGDQIKALSDWTSARETFTKNTVAQMVSSMPSGYAGAVCYNQDYTNSNPSLISDITSAKLKSGLLLHTDYDCFYMKTGNTFTGKGDGGYINIATGGHSSCKYNSSSKTFTC